MKMMRLKKIMNPWPLRMLLYAAIFSWGACAAAQAAPAPLEQDLHGTISPALYSYLQVDDEPLYDKKRLKERWKQLTPQQRERIRERYRRFQELTPDEQARIRERLEWFKNLPSDERRELREKWQRMTPEERKHFRKELKEQRKQRRSAYKHDV